MRSLMNPKLAEEIELDRPASGWPERLFRFSVGYFLIVGLLDMVLRIFASEKTLEAKLGVLGHAVGGLFGVCFLYMLNYGAYRFVRTRWIRWTWFGLEGLVVLLLLTYIVTR